MFGIKTFVDCVHHSFNALASLRWSAHQNCARRPPNLRRSTQINTCMNQMVNGPHNRCGLTVETRHSRITQGIIRQAYLPGQPGSALQRRRPCRSRRGRRDPSRRSADGRSTAPKRAATCTHTRDTWDQNDLRRPSSLQGIGPSSSLLQGIGSSREDRGRWRGLRRRVGRPDTRRGRDGLQPHGLGLVLVTVAARGRRGAAGGRPWAAGLGKRLAGLA